MADEETPYENLDVGYVEWPMPTTEELQTVRFLNKQGVAELWAKINDKFFRIPYGGEPGQVLSKTESGFSWKDVISGNFIEYPSGGESGQALLKTNEGVSWGDVVVDIPETPIATSSIYGLVKFPTNQEFDSYFEDSSDSSENSLISSYTPSMYQVKRLLNNKKAENPNQSEYIELEYVDVPDNQYVTTNIKTTQNTRIIMDISLLRTPGVDTGCLFFGSAYPAQNNGIECYAWLDPSNRPKINIVYNSSIYYPQTEVGLGDRLYIDWNGNTVNIYKNDTLICMYTLSYTQYTSAANLRLFGLARSGKLYAGSVRVYSVKIYENGDLLKNLVPVKKLSGEIGFFDWASETFYGNSGTGSFIGGPEVDSASYTNTPITLAQLYSVKPKNAIIFNPYTILNYITLTGTQCIDTKFKPNQNTRVYAKLDIDSYQPSNVSDTVAIFGGRTSSTTSTASFTLWRLSSSTFEADYGTTKNQINLGTTGSFEIDFNKNSISINSTTRALSSSNFQSANNLLIASTYTNSGSSNYEDSKNQDVRRFSGKIYWFKIYDNGVLVRDYVPAKRVTDGIIGLYDRANDVFYENSGTGSFIGGPEV